MRSSTCYFLAVAAVLGCGSDPDVKPVGQGQGGTGGGRGGGGSGGVPFAVPGGGGTTGSGAAGGAGGGGSYTQRKPCVNLECQQETCALGDCKQKACASGTTTSISGVVFDPAAKVPLYNVLVYVPNAPLAPIPSGATCDRCESPISGSPIAATLTNAKGEFRLERVPVGSNVPLVIQIGKWRRQVSVPAVVACTNTAVTDRNLTRLPRNQAEGHIPKVAITTGERDSLECLLRKVGISDSEFTGESGTGRINLYAGFGGTKSYAPAVNAGGNFSPAVSFWNNPENLKKYDMVILSCEGTQDAPNKPAVARQAMKAYADAGGRIFASHWHNYWLEAGPAPWPMVATFKHQADLPNPFTSALDTSFPKGMAFADWLVNVGASTTRGQLVIREGQHTVDASNPMMASRWIYSTTPNSVQYFTFNTPLGTASQCGRVVFTDIHVSVGDVSSASTRWPNGCKTTDLSPQEKALEFMLFDLSSCVQSDEKPPAIPLIE